MSLQNPTVLFKFKKNDADVIKHRLLTFVAAVSCLSLISWNIDAKRAIVMIAENHLTPLAKEKIAELTDGRSLMDVCTKTDDDPSTLKSKDIALWHFVNLPSGIVTKSQFEGFAIFQTNPNMLQVLTRLKYEISGTKNIMNPSDWQVPPAQQKDDLAILIALIADMHQPLNFSPYEYDLGRKAPVSFHGKKTTLYQLLNDGLFRDNRFSYQQFAKSYDTVNLYERKDKPTLPMEVMGGDPLNYTTWAFESYRLCDKIYRDINSSKNINDQYFQNLSAILKQRMEKAGMRLALYLNDLFLRGSLTIASYSEEGIRKPFSGQSFAAIGISDCVNYMGYNVKLCGKVFNIKKHADSTMVSVGESAPGKHFSVLLKGEAMFIADSLMYKNIAISGVLVNDRGRPEIIGNKIYHQHEQEGMTGNRFEIKLDLGVELVIGPGNDLFEPGDVNFKPIRTTEAADNIGKLVSMRAKVVGIKKMESGINIVYLDTDYPDCPAEITLNNGASSLIDQVMNREILVSGSLHLNYDFPHKKRFPAIAVLSPNYLKIE